MEFIASLATNYHMTLATVSRYERDHVSNVGDHAVVVGGSVAGLLAARVLADGFEEVTIVERDSLSDEPTARRGVPQGRHVHALMEAGRATFEDLFPGYSEELLSAGGVLIDVMADVSHYEQGDYLADGETRSPMYCATRPLLEQIVRRRVTDRDGVEIRADCQHTDYLVDATTVAGVRVRNGDSERETITADLVVDATGRASKTPTWLEDHGYEAPDVEEVRIDLAYSTVVIERPPDDRRAFVVPPDPPRTRGVGMFPAEDSCWVVTLFGVHGDHPPTDADGLKEFASRVPGLDLRQLLDTRSWLSDEIAHYPFPSNRRHRYEGLDRFPNGLVVIGDAIASFNPIYAQGMSVVALEALALHHVLATGGREGLAHRFFDRAGEVVDAAWSIAVGGDFEFPQTTGPKPAGTDLLNRYQGRLLRKAHTDSELREALVRVFNMEESPTSLFRPGVVGRVLKPTWSDLGPTSRRASTRSSTNTPRRK